MSVKVKDVMVEEVISVSEKMTVRNAAELMDKHEIGCVVVAKAGEPIGILTETDMVKRVILKQVDAKRTKVGKIMSKPIVVGSPQMDVNDASKIMRERKIKKLPVVENGRLVGLVTTTDLIRSPEVMKLMIKAIKINLIREIIAAIQEKLEL